MVMPVTKFLQVARKTNFKHAKNQVFDHLSLLKTKSLFTFINIHSSLFLLQVESRELKICHATARRRAFKTERIFLWETITMNNLWSKKCSELRSHSPYNIKLSIATSLEQRGRMLRRERCYRSPFYSRNCKCFYVTRTSLKR